jgi:hypothetical protein
MPKYYIQAEAFNLDHVAYDTNDISTIRGGSFILLDAVKRLPEAIGQLEPIATAASKGVFAYEDSGDLDSQMAGMAQKVLRALHRFTGGHATFLVAIEEDFPKDFRKVLARLESNVRRQQWRMPTVVVPPFEDTEQECYLDGWRPGVVPYTVDPDVAGAKISMAADFRRKVGREIKQHLFSQLLNDPTYGDDLVTKDLGKLATDPSKGILNGKIALIQVDGNSFGRIRNKICDTASKRKEFDNAIQEGCRNKFLRDVLTRARADPDFHVIDGGKMAMRIELLLWGGDEFTLVVPAWKGLEVLERFYRIADGLRFDNVPMTHRAAVIFCHHNAPILQIRRLANSLLSKTRNDISKKFNAAFTTDPLLASLAPIDRTQQLECLSNPKYGNAARYLVLESFDILRGSLEQFFERYYGRSDTSDMLLYGHKMSELRSNFQTICVSASKGRVVEAARAIRKGDTARVDELCNSMTDSVAPDKQDGVRKAIAAITKDNDAGWYLLADLWDYAEEWKA